MLPRCCYGTRVEGEAELVLVAASDRMIPPDAQRGMAKWAGATIVEKVDEQRNPRAEHG